MNTHQDGSGAGEKRGLSYGLQRHLDPNLNRIYTKNAGELATLIMQLYDRVASGDLRTLRLGVPEADAVVQTMWAGSVTVIMGRPSHRKSSTMKHMARLEAGRILELGRERVEMVVYATLEEPDEEVALKVAGAPFGVAELAKRQVDRREAIRWSEEAAKLPLVTVGHHRTDLSRAMVDRPPRLTIEQAYREIQQAIEDDDRRPVALFLDYIQKAATESRSETEKNQRVAYVVGQLVDIAKRLDVPAVVGAQAGRQVDDRVPPIPALGDGMWTSVLEQDADVVLSCWYPYKSELHTRELLAGRFGSAGMSFDNVHLDMARVMAPDTMVLALRKQRMGLGVGLWACKVDPATGALSAWPTPSVPVGGRP